MQKKLQLLAVVVLLSFVGDVAAQLAYTEGHGDIGVGYEDTGSGFELHPHWHLGPATVNGGSVTDNEYEASEIFAVVPDSPVARPGGAQWDFLGVGSGQNLWILPQSQDPGVPFLGLATEELSGADWSTDLTFSLSGFSGPGDFSLYATDGFGTPTAYWVTSDGLAAGDAFAMAAGNHAHFNWAFTSQGSYALDITISGTHVTDGFQSATETFEFNVVPEPSTYMLFALAGMLLAGRKLKRRR